MDQPTPGVAPRRHPPLSTRCLTTVDTFRLPGSCHTGFVEWFAVAPTVRTEDLIDAHEVAELLGLSQRNSVSTYLKRYEDMPRPIIERGNGRTRLWLRPEVERWAQDRTRRLTEKD